MPKGSAAQQAADCNIIRHIEMRFTCWINKATDNVPKGSAAQQAADCNIIRHIEMRFTCWVNKDTDTNSDYILLICFPHQNLLRERTYIVPHLYIARPVYQYTNSAVDKSIMFLNTHNTQQ